MMTRFSIIVPVYKVERYINKCVDSILNQTFTDFELILIDDGSPDNCGRICDMYAQKDNRVKVIHKENGGQGSARNIGLEIAKGRYVCFVDSDDYIDKNMLMDIYSEINKKNSDIVIFGVYKIKNEKIIEKIFKSLPTNKIKLNLLTDEWENWPCNKCFDRNLFLNKKFPEGIVFEDLYLIPAICLEAGKITVIEKAYYFYNNDNENATTSKMSSLKWYDFFYALKKNRELCYQEGISIDLLKNLEKRCISIARKSIFVYFNDGLLDMKQYIVLKEFLEGCFNEGKVIGAKNRFLIYLIIKNKLWLCKMYAKFRGY